MSFNYSDTSSFEKLIRYSFIGKWFSINASNASMLAAYPVTFHKRFTSSESHKIFCAFHCRLNIVHNNGSPTVLILQSAGYVEVQNIQGVCILRKPPQPLFHSPQKIWNTLEWKLQKTASSFQRQFSSLWPTNSTLNSSKTIHSIAEFFPSSHHSFHILPRCTCRTPKIFTTN